MAINIAYISTQFEQWEGRKLTAYIPCFVKPEAQARVGKASRLRLWRSFLGWVLALMFAWEVVGRPIVLTYWPETVLPESSLSEVSRLLLGMLGLGW